MSKVYGMNMNYLRAVGTHGQGQLGFVEIRPLPPYLN